jgi:hypothetical protein
VTEKLPKNTMKRKENSNLGAGGSRKDQLHRQ